VSRRLTTGLSIELSSGLSTGEMRFKSHKGMMLKGQSRIRSGLAFFVSARRKIKPYPLE